MEEKTFRTFLPEKETQENTGEDIFLPGEDTQFQRYKPSTFLEYVGQEALREKLLIYTKAARFRNEPLDHVLLFGAPGLGKTTLAHIIASEMQSSIKICSGPTLERSGDLVAILSSLTYKEVLFIDEIHRLSPTVEEILYTAMEEFCIDVVVGQGIAAKSVRLPLQPFTLIGATTMSGKISAPLRSRFSIIEQLELYSAKELQQIILKTAESLQFSITEDAACMLGAASRSTPRIAKKLLRRVRDFAQIKGCAADVELVCAVLQALGISKDGLTKQERFMLEMIAQKFNGGPVGIETLAAVLIEDVETIEQVYEPFLMQKGYLEKTARGRQIPQAMLANMRKQQLLF